MTRDTTSNALARLRALYQKKDRLEATVTLQKQTYVAPRKQVDYEFHVNPGPQVQVLVEGVRLSKSRLHLLVPIFEEGTIDNDLYGTDFTIGYDTAINTAMEAVDKIRDTAESHNRTFFVEVMGRNSGFIALDVALATGAEFIAVPETATNFEALCEYMWSFPRPKRHIFIISEGDEYGGAQKFADDFKKRFDIDTRVTILGHLQRGGSPTARDRILATKLGAAAVQALLDGEKSVMAGEINGRVTLTPMRETWEKRPQLSTSLCELVETLR